MLYTQARSALLTAGTRKTNIPLVGEEVIVVHSLFAYYYRKDKRSIIFGTIHRGMIEFQNFKMLAWKRRQNGLLRERMHNAILLDVSTKT